MPDRTAELAASEAAVAGRTTERLRARAGLASFGAVLVTLFLPQPAVVPRWTVVSLTLALGLLMPFLRGRLEDGWQRVGPYLSLGYVLAVVMLTGGPVSVYTDLVLIVVAMTALTRSLAMTTAVTVLAAALNVLPALLTSAPAAHVTDGLLDSAVMAAVAGLMYQQSAGLRRQAAALEAEAGETRKLLEREHDVVLQLQQIQDARTTFGRNLSHEIRTPMTVLGGSLALLDGGDVPPERVSSLIPAMARAYERLQELLTSVERIYDSDRITLIRADHTLEALVATAISRSPVDASQVDVEVCHETVTVDGELLVDALVRILRNVHKHTPRGTRVRVEAEVTDDTLDLRVADDGPGWDRQDPSELIEPFVQGHASASDSEPGVGVGLALVNAAVQAHDGEVQLSTDPRTGGAVVRLLLPAVVSEVHAEVG